MLGEYYGYEIIFDGQEHVLMDVNDHSMYKWEENTQSQQLLTFGSVRVIQWIKYNLNVIWNVIWKTDASFDNYSSINESCWTEL